MDSNKDQSQEYDEHALEQPQQLNAADSSGVQEEIHLAPEDAVPIGTQKTSRHILQSLKGAFNIYLLLFALLVIVSVIVFIVAYLNSKDNKTTGSTAAVQELTQKDLSDLASGDAKIGDPKYILNVQSDAIFAGSALVRKDLNVAGNLQLGQALNVGNVTVSGTGNFNTVQINTLAVAGAAAIQGKLSSQSDVVFARGLNVGGTITAGSITTSSLTLGGNGNLNLNNHINATGPTPGRSQGGAVGSGGSTSINGSDIAGTLTVNTGTNPGAGCFATINFVQRFSGTPHVIVSPIGSAAAQVQYYATKSATGFSVCAANTPPASQSFSFDYFVID
jgi:hypothetical protein